MREIKFRAWLPKTKTMLYKGSLIDLWGYSWLYNGGLANAIPMQYTGLKDKNGKEIYEGDIIRGIYSGYTQNWEVNELSEYGVTFTRLTCEPRNPHYFYRDMRHRDQWEIIGNIYENPELLKG